MRRSLAVDINQNKINKPSNALTAMIFDYMLSKHGLVFFSKTK
jgi:hypothetical protein